MSKKDKLIAKILKGGEISFEEACLMKKYQPIDYYVSLPWSFQVEWLEDPALKENWTVYVKELPGCKTHGKTPQEAINHIYEAIESYILSLIEDQQDIPAPVNPQDFKGNLSVRTSPEKHYELARVAQRQGKSVNKLLNEAIDTVISRAS